MAYRQRQEWGGPFVSADLDPDAAASVRGQSHASGGMLTTAGLAAVLTGALVVWLAVELRIRGTVWLPWTILALPPAAAGVVCLAWRSRWHDAAGPAAVLGGCVAAVGVCVPVGPLQRGAAMTIVAVLAVAGGTGAVAAVVALRALQPPALARGSRLRLWWAAAVMVTVLSVPSPAYFPPGPIGTVFTGDSPGQAAAVGIGLLLLALPLLAAGVVPARTSAAIAACWLPVAAAQLIAGPVVQTAPASLDAWYYLSWLPWLAVALLALAEARASRAGAAAQAPLPPG